MADGGEGTLRAFEAATPGAKRMPITVHGPASEPVDTYWLRLPPTIQEPGGTAVVELASTSGIELLGGDLRPWDSDSRGFGEAIAAALSAGVSKLVLGIGSSASTDGGVGMLTALGARFIDMAGSPVAPGARGLRALAAVDFKNLAPMPEAGVVVLTDVDNPLLGPRGAAAVFGPQKGLYEPEQAETGLAGLARLVGADATYPGTGAAGGVGFALHAWGAVMARGAEQVARLIGLRSAVNHASVVITGEGSFDSQTAAGKVPAHVAALAALTGTPVMLVTGRVTDDADTSQFLATVVLSELAGGAQFAIADPTTWLRAAGAEAARSLAPGP